MVVQLRGAQKAAILLFSLGEDAAAEVIKNLSADEVDALAPYLDRFNGVAPRDVERVAREFYLAAQKGPFLPAAPETKTAYLKKILLRAVGEDKSRQLMDGMLDQAPSGHLEQLKWHDPTTIARFLLGEHPQVIAVIAANLGDPDLTRRVVSALPEGLRQNVLARIVRLREISPEWIDEIEAALDEELQGEETEETEETEERGVSAKSGEAAGASRVAGVMNSASQRLEQNALGHIEARDPELAERIRVQMFPFEDFLKVDNPGMQRILERVTNEDLLLALGTADEPLRRHFLGNLSADTASGLERAMVSYQPMQLSDIRAARKRLSNTARELARLGQLSVLKTRI